MNTRVVRLTVYLLGILTALMLSLVISVIFMRPPFQDLVDLALLFGLTGVGSGLLGYLSHRLGWWRHLASLSRSLTLGYVLAAGLTLFNVWLTARLMFINDHDLALAGLLLLFSSGISISFGYFLSHSLTQTVRELVQGARRLHDGDFSVRVPVHGRDELAQLATTFNEMAENLEQARAETTRQEAIRREFVAGASHDLRTPLASLRAMIHALADGVVDDRETVGRYLEQSQREIERMSALIDDLFELAQLDAGTPLLRFESGSMYDLISDALGSVAARAEARDIRLHGEVPPDVDPLMMAADKISRVIQNLLDNALRHTQAGGEVMIEAWGEPERVVVRVCDTGVGVAAEDLPHVFERFYRGEKSRARPGSESTGGAGLGLAIARGLIEAHGGEISIESVPEQGTQVTFWLPRRQEQVKKKPKEALEG